MQHGLVRDELPEECAERGSAGSAQGRGDDSADTLATLIGGAVLVVALMFCCLMCILALFSASQAVRATGAD